MAGQACPTCVVCLRPSRKTRVTDADDSSWKYLETPGRGEKGSGKILGSCLLRHKMSGLDRAGYRLGCKELKVPWTLRKVPRTTEALSTFYQGRVYLPPILAY